MNNIDFDFYAIFDESLIKNVRLFFEVHEKGDLFLMLRDESLIDDFDTK